MDLLYHITIGIAILAVSPFIVLRMAIDPEFRADITQRLRGGEPVPALRDSLWIHAASVGEVRAAKILINSMIERGNRRPIILSTFTRAGYELACADGLSPVFRLPPDFPLWLEPLFHKINPAALILIEAELWPCLLRLCRQHNVPVLLVNGRMSEKSFNRYHAVKALFRWITAPVKLFSMRTSADADRVEKLGIPASAIRITGNMKFDALADDREPIKDSLLVVFGSTRPGDEEPALDAVARLRREVPDARFVLAPRHINRIPEIVHMARNRGLDFKLHSHIAENKNLERTALIILDRMGELNHYYAQSSVAFVGGGFDPSLGGQNILEPAAFYQPVIFGRHMNNFAEEARLLTASGGGIQIAGPEELHSVLLRLLTNPEERQRIGKLAGEIVKNNRGAVQRNAELIEKLLQTT